MDCVAGLDFGTTSVRGVLLDAGSGARLASEQARYRHGVMEAKLPGGAALPPGYALQDVRDYVDAAAQVLERIGRGRRIVGIGIDGTASSPLPARRDGMPLCASLPDEPHAYLKLWKHHAAQAQADRINAAEPGFLRRTGGRTSSEWSLAKAMQVAEETPHVWAATERWIEAADWIVWQLTGRESRSRCLAACKAHHEDGIGYPDAFLEGYPQRMDAGAELLGLGHVAGTLTDGWLDRTGIVGPTRVASAVVDAHAVLPAVGVTAPGTWLATLGTSACYLSLDRAAIELPGLSGSLLDSAVPGHWCHEAGQPAFGDALAWAARILAPGEGESGIEAQARAAAALDGRSDDRLLALDWWNGNRCPHGDTDLSGMVLGLRPDTTAAEIFRAVETGLCFGARQIRDAFAERGVSTQRVVVTGGVAERSASLLQRLADVLGSTLHRPRMTDATAVGAAIHGAVAAGVCHGYAEAADRFGAKAFDVFHPDNHRAARFDHLYPTYRALSADETIRSAMRALR